MSNNTSKRYLSRTARHQRVRRKVEGSVERPRLCVFRSAKHIYAQAIDDARGVTLAAASTTEKEVAEAVAGKTGNKSAAEQVGKVIAERLLKKNIDKVVFDRGGFIYHGRVRALAESARGAGLNF